MTAGTLARRTLLGHTFRCTNRTYAHLLWTIAELKRLHPEARLIIIQACYNTGVEESAGTHDFDGVLDVRIVGMTWWDAQLFLRRCGWAAWYRFPPTFSEHIHMCSIPEGLTNTPTLDQINHAYAAAGIHVGIYVPGQIDDYFAHALGLKGQHRAGVDRSRFPRDIAATIYRYREDWFDMATKAELKDAIREVLAEPLVTPPPNDADFSGGKPVGLAAALRRIWRLSKGA